MTTDFSITLGKQFFSPDFFSPNFIPMDCSEQLLKKGITYTYPIGVLKGGFEFFMSIKLPCLVFLFVFGGLAIQIFQNNIYIFYTYLILRGNQTITQLIGEER
jgi:hypothetical protein